MPVHLYTAESSRTPDTRFIWKEFCVKIKNHDGAGVACLGIYCQRPPKETGKIFKNKYIKKASTEILIHMF